MAELNAGEAFARKSGGGAPKILVQKRSFRLEG